MLTPIELIRATVDGMAQRGFGRIVNITSSAVKAPIDILGLSNGARSGLTGFVAGVARSPLAARGVTINNLLPGKFDTDRLASTFAAQAARTGRSLQEGAGRAHRGHSGGAPGRGAGVWRDLRLFVQRACGLHYRPELAGRWGRLSGRPLTGPWCSTNATTGAGGCPCNSRFSQCAGRHGRRWPWLGACSRWGWQQSRRNTSSAWLAAWLGSASTRSGRSRSGAGNCRA